MIQSFEQIMNDLKQRIYHPVYFLAGNEPYYIDRITEFIAGNVLKEEEKAFNQIVVYGKDSDAKSVVNLARRFPMMAPHTVVILKEAQDLPSIDDFEHYINAPLKSSILVINYKYKTIGKKKEIYKALENNGVYFESKPIYEDRIPLWTEKYLKARGYTMEAGVGMMLTEYLGNNLSRITGELDKLMIVLPENEKRITTSHIEEYVGISKEYNNFEFTNALGGKNVVKSNRIARHFANNQNNHPFTLTISAIYFFFSKVMAYQQIGNKENAAAELGIREYFLKEYIRAARNYSPGNVRQIISLLREYDMKSKGFYPVSTDPGELLRELVYKILHLRNI